MRRYAWKKAAAAAVLLGTLSLSGCANADFAADTSVESVAETEETAPQTSVTPAPTAAPAKLNPLEDQFSTDSSISAEENLASENITGITNSGVNVHSSPRGETTDSLPDEAEVDVLGRDGDWFLVRYEDVEGYIYGQFLDIDGVNGLDLDEDAFGNESQD